jgi:membrane protease YdiL (CAAX protease family)
VRRRRSRERDWPLQVFIASFTALLITGIVHAATLNVRFGDELELSPTQISEAWRQVVTVEIVDSLIVVAAFIAVRGEPRRTVDESHHRLLATAAAAPLLLVMLGINYLYHAGLRSIVQLPEIEDQLMDERSWLAFFAVCVQPAIVEEAYCRGLAIGVLREFVGRHATVWIAAVAFGLMHVSAAISIPYLIVVGGFLGYLRLATGSVWPPIVIHFLHNLAIQTYEWS